MQPTNNKALFHVMTGVMEDLREGKISKGEALTYAKLGLVAIKCLYYELDRAKTELLLSQVNEGTVRSVEIRQIEGKLFNNELL